MNDQSGIGVSPEFDDVSNESFAVGIFPYCTDGSYDFQFENSQPPNLPEVGEADEHEARLFSFAGQDVVHTSDNPNTWPEDGKF